MAKGDEGRRARLAEGTAVIESLSIASRRASLTLQVLDDSANLLCRRHTDHGMEPTSTGIRRAAGRPGTQRHD